MHRPTMEIVSQFCLLRIPGHPNEVLSGQNLTRTSQQKPFSNQVCICEELGLNLALLWQQFANG